MMVPVFTENLRTLSYQRRNGLNSAKTDRGLDGLLRLAVMYVKEVFTHYTTARFALLSLYLYTHFYVQGTGVKIRLDNKHPLFGEIIQDWDGGFEGAK
ncbi:hypothetical protein NPIL_422171 [Nephila pilipes]|uniref:Uncharacterized protein n=1 Tax=Nephila pilipes TaxID=299642 RepID=A0A8X6NAB7_NEPPI|nr:hypothetical protein NPIL_422171 [Nephila pilipes]